MLYIHFSVTVTLALGKKNPVWKKVLILFFVLEYIGNIII